MSFSVRTSLAGVRRGLGWLLATKERMADVVLLAGPLVLLAGAALIENMSNSPAVSNTQLTLLWTLLLLATGGWLVALAVFRQRGWLIVAGPLLYYDLVRIARRSRYFLLRFLYALLLGFLLSWIYLIWYMETEHRSLTSREMARFAESFFYTFLAVQFLVVAVLTPAYTAGAIAEEKERKTLEFLLATDLRNREIVLSKYFSRLFNLILLLLTGLPILSFLQFVGGVDPNLLLGAFAGTGMTMLSLAGLSLFNSVLTKKPRDAIALTYLMAGAYLIVSGASWILLNPRWGLAKWPSTTTWSSPVTLEDVVIGFSSGNPVAVVVRIIFELERGKAVTASLPGILSAYALCHGILMVLLVGWAVLRLRALALKQSYGETQKVSLKTRLLPRPRLKTNPMLWKEVFAESGLRFNLPARVVAVILILASFVPVVFIFAELVGSLGQPRGGLGFRRGYSVDAWDEFSNNMNVWVRVVGTIVACLMLLAVAARSASCVSNERDRQTMDALLTSPLDNNSILFAKWLGNILSVRWAWLWLGAIYLLGLLTGGLHLLAVPLLLLAWIVYAAVLSGFGTWFSIISRTTLRATIWTLMVTVGAGVGHWMLWLCCIPFFIAMRGPEPPIMKWMRDFQVGFTPPAALSYAFPFSPDNLYGEYERMPELGEIVGFALLGLFCWAGIAGYLWVVASTRFRLVTGRLPIQRPQLQGAYPPRPPSRSPMKGPIDGQPRAPLAEEASTPPQAQMERQ
jgi:ABC-type transport system involved in multi-copper enzyme maturation permease subunit